jgi:type I restriction enzyme S subunit
VGTAGRVAIFREDTKVVVDSHVSILRVDQTNVDPDFIFYNLRGREKEIEETAETAEGSTGQIELSRNGIRNIEIFMPGLPEQKAIAEVLSSLDDKIDLLHRQNKTLEALAETLFRQWFVEEASEDWEEKSLLDVIDLQGGGTPKTSVPEFWGGDIPWLSGGDIAAGHKAFIMSSEKNITDLGVKKSSAKLLPKLATVISARGTVGKFAMLSRPMAYSQSNYGIFPKIKDCFFFTYLLINHVVNELQSSAYGSVFDTITTATFKDVCVKIPKESEIQSFEEKIANYYWKKLNNLEQVRILEQLCDALLPKLMSGEVRVSYDFAQNEELA